MNTRPINSIPAEKWIVLCCSLKLHVNLKTNNNGNVPTHHYADLRNTVFFSRIHCERNDNSQACLRNRFKFESTQRIFEYLNHEWKRQYEGARLSEELSLL